MKTIRNFLMKPAKLKPDIVLDGWFACEYKHGLHCFWDGGLSRGQLLRDIPWVHTPTYTSDLVTATGLWSTSLQPIPMSDAWLNRLPTIPIEGVIYKEAGVKYLGAVASPCLSEIFKSGPVYHRTTCGNFNLKRNLAWIKTRKEEVGAHFLSCPPNTSFERELKFLDMSLDTYGGAAHLIQHKQLPKVKSSAAITTMKSQYPNGFTVRSPASIWTPSISDHYFLII